MRLSWQSSLGVSVVISAGVLAACGSGDNSAPGPAGDSGITDGTASDVAHSEAGAADGGGPDGAIASEAGSDSAADSGDATTAVPDAGDGGGAGDSGEGGLSEAAADGGDAGDAGAALASIKHVVVIYLENHSFDNLFGSWPGADGLGDGGVSIPQVGPDGGPYETLPQYGPDPANVGSLADAGPIGNAAFDLTTYFQENSLTNDLLHRFYQEQAQINAGKMDSFVLWNDESAGQSMGYWPTATLPVPQWMKAHASSVTLLDHFYHAAFGGSFLNHFWLIAAQSPKFPNAPASIVAMPNDAGLLPPVLDTTSVPPNAVYNTSGSDGQVTPDGYAVNTTYSVNEPHPPAYDTGASSPTKLLPQQTFPTIADELDGAGVSWAWYAGGWNVALANAGIPSVGTDAGSEAIPGGSAAILDLFEYHHQPFVYFQNWGGTAADGGTAGPGTVPNGKWAQNHNLQDEEDFVAAAVGGTLPAVSFVKPLYDEHPNYTTETDSQANTVDLINDVVSGPQWNETVIIITYDENGGQWDHVAPPATDKWGPGTRVPGIVISPFAKGGVDSTAYDTTAILKLIEKRWNLASLSTRDSMQSDLSAHALTFTR
jgi:acid phosphatase